MKKIFFIIPVYKVEEFLQRCIESVLRQSYGSVQLVLVDDGSPDRCPEICDRYAEKFDNIKVIHKQNGGLSEARNAGLRYILEVAGEDDYITFLDSDDFVREDFAEKLILLCEQNSCGCAQCDYEKGNANGFTPVNSGSSEFFTDSDSALLNQKLKSQSCAKIYKVSAFNGVSYPVGMLNEDEFTTYRAVYNSKNVAFTTEKLYYYYQRDFSIMTEIARKLKNNPHSFDWLKAYEERIEFFEKQNKPEQVLRTHEKICTDIILRYSEQMYLKKDDRDKACISGEYLRIYRNSYRKMMGRQGISLSRRLMYIAFNILPYSAVIMGKIFGLRK